MDEIDLAEAKIKLHEAHVQQLRHTIAELTMIVTATQMSTPEWPEQGSECPLVGNPIPLTK